MLCGLHKCSDAIIIVRNVVTADMVVMVPGGEVHDYKSRKQ